ncbi:HAD-IB family phosphatase [uncultured Fusobacterium sp.]|uniref:HAD-IB family phosphatase n=1 Tax=uncultured Fusobacterium sp. TaxID=159267 RepID=UPI0025EF15BD|nr:HAD-IB family phosphatase [uncultured Fusobacterium sp.]
MKKINVYDFDKTIYQKDCSVEFWRFCLSKNKSLIFILPYQVLMFSLNKLGMISIEKCKEEFFSFLKVLKRNEIENLVLKFWEKEIKNLNKELKEIILKSELENICISASPEFLLKIPCEKLKINLVIGTKYNMDTYEIEGKNCKGKEKIERLNLEKGNYAIENFYSDSLSDLPLFKIAKNKFILKNSKIQKLKLEDKRC